MSAPMPLLVFTDLDGTLLSHGDYSWDAARPALERLRRMGAGVVMASSKTAPEIHGLRAQMGLEGFPAIVENGSGLLEAHAAAVEGGATYAQLRAVLSKISAQLQGQFTGFGDMTPAQIASATGLPRADAALAGQRAFSEPGIWSGTDDDRAAFIAALAAHGVSAREGGRFLTLSFGQTKADRMAQITARFAPRHTAALGDAPNDTEMLEAADFGIIVANPHRAALPPLAGEASGRITRTDQEGPEGWNTGLLALIARLELK